MTDKRFEPHLMLAAAGGVEDGRLDLARMALAYAAEDHPGLSHQRYLHHLDKLAADTGARYDALIEGGAADGAATRLAALKHVIADQEGYDGDRETYDDPQNCDLFRVIDRRRGMPIALAILYLHAARAQGWTADGINFPGHFLCRIAQGSERILFDPFERCAVMGAPELRALIKSVQGAHAELKPEHYLPAANRDILIRLQNNIKLRLIEAEDYAGALRVVERMRVANPDEYRLLFDAGILYAKTGRAADAAEVLRAYVAVVPDARLRLDALAILAELDPG